MGLAKLITPHTNCDNVAHEQASGTYIIKVTFILSRNLGRIDSWETFICWIADNPLQNVLSPIL